VTWTLSSIIFVIGASAAAHMMPGLFAPLAAVEAVIFLSVILLQ
jgi:hypothetical protein